MQKDSLFLMKCISCKIESNINSVLSSYGITFQQSHILVYLIKHKEEKINQRNLEERFQTKSSTISGIIKRLEAKELIEKRKLNEDNRNNYLFVTDKGYKLFDVLEKNRIEYNNILFNSLSEEDIKSLEIILKKIINNIENGEVKND